MYPFNILDWALVFFLLYTPPTHTLVTSHKNLLGVMFVQEIRKDKKLLVQW